MIVESVQVTAALVLNITNSDSTGASVAPSALA
jgi:hypothetical protein